jgi:hypothetical protein
MATVPFGRKRQGRLHIPQAHLIKSLAVAGHHLAFGANLHRNGANFSGGGIHIAIGRARGIPGLRQEEGLHPVKGQAIVEAPLHQVGEVAGSEGGAVAIQGDHHAPSGGV